MASDGSFAAPPSAWEPNQMLLSPRLRSPKYPRGDCRHDAAGFEAGKRPDLFPRPDPASRIMASGRRKYCRRWQTLPEATSRIAKPT